MKVEYPFRANFIILFMLSLKEIHLARIILNSFISEISSLGNENAGSYGGCGIFIALVKLYAVRLCVMYM